jgi:hypothetical protein
MVPYIAKEDQPLAQDQRDGDVAGQQCIKKVFGQLPHGAVEELDHVMTGMEAGQFFIRQQDTVAQTVLPPEDDRLVSGGDRLVDLLMGDVTFLHVPL